MEAAQKAGFQYPGGDLGRPDHHAGEYRLRRCRAERFDDPRQMRRHRRSHRPGGGERERQHHHRSIDRNVRLDCGPFGGGDPLRPRQQQIERQADHDVRDRPGVAGLSPADRLEPQRAQRPADGAGEAGDQRDAGDRGAARRCRRCAPTRRTPHRRGRDPCRCRAAARPPTSSRSRSMRQEGQAPPRERRWRRRGPAVLRRDRSGARPGGRAVRRSPATPRTRQRTSCSRSRGRARSDRPGWPADSSSIPTPASGQCPALR